jgi:hypothetical protein
MIKKTNLLISYIQVEAEIQMKVMENTLNEIIAKAFPNLGEEMDI